MPRDAPVYSLYDEREEILKALYTFHNSRTKTAEFLGIDKSTLVAENEKISHSSSMIFHTKNGNARNGAFPIFDQYFPKSMLL